jgi:hydrogenase maturation protein HypF
LSARARRRLLVRGVVQGVGFRPFVFRLASSLELAGSVRNTPQGVVIEIEGPSDRLDAFAERLRTEAPPLAEITRVRRENLPVGGDSDFVILPSEADSRATARIPADVALCADCAAEIIDPQDRRASYPFTNCTNCGPRFTIITDLPYDRPQTTMGVFTLCSDCRREYEDPRDRRFHAQPNACPVCGPSLFLDGEKGDPGEVLTAVGRLLREGKIVAIKGLGGYHLACDARNAAAVQTLRERKGRGRKPFALMCASLEEARRVVEMDDAAAALLSSPEAPIALLPAREGSGIAPEVAPGNRDLGVMLPYTPLHRLLFQSAPSCLVMTSGNLAEEPMEHRDEPAHRKLARIADHFLTHDREIHMACDDSVVRPYSGGVLPVRRSRGYAPRPLSLGRDTPTVLAVGGEQRNTFCLAQAGDAVLSQHIGDLDNAETFEYYQQAIDHFLRLFQASPVAVAHDLHPDYLSTRYALRRGLPCIAVQHHHAHIASVMAEHGLSGPVLGLAFDGTGYGDDHTVWGGEFLAVQGATHQRLAHLRALPLPGGAAAIRRPPRMALAYLLDAFGERAHDHAAELLPSLPEVERTVIAHQARTGLNSPLTSSMGRLFDAVSGLLGGPAMSTYEGQAAIELEMLARPSFARETTPYPYAVEEGAALTLDLRPTITAIVTDRRSGAPTADIAARFHRTVIAAVTDVCERLRAQGAPNDVALGGGCFQNLLLLEGIVETLAGRGFTVYVHSRVPPNDGGLSLGQAWVAIEALKVERKK